MSLYPSRDIDEIVVTMQQMQVDMDNMRNTITVMNQQNQVIKEQVGQVLEILNTPEERDEITEKMRLFMMRVAQQIKEVEKAFHSMTK